MTRGVIHSFGGCFVTVCPFLGYSQQKSSRCKFIRQLDLPVMTALANGRSRHAPYEVEKVLREMFRVYEETNDQNLRPTSRSFGACVSCSLLFS